MLRFLLPAMILATATAAPAQIVPPVPVVPVITTEPQNPNSESLADIRREMQQMFVELALLKRQLNTSDDGQMPRLGMGSALDRLAAVEAELQNLTAKTEELEFRIRNIVRDGTARLGDLEFRLVELEGGDVSKLAETSTLGGAEGAGFLVPDILDPMPVPQYAIAEQSDFKAAEALLSNDLHAEAAQAYEKFLEAYPISPFAAQAQLGLAQAYEGQEKLQPAGRAYLAAFTLAEHKNPELASQAMLGLGVNLAALGQTDPACKIFSQISQRYPDFAASQAARSERAEVSCP
ncbi:MAG: tetratricopeptide repeat protein [Mangrovicoccus sp.]